MPEQNNVVLINTTVSAWDIFRALATINGTAMAPMYETAMCCRPRVSICRTGKTRSTGCTVAADCVGDVADDMGKHLWLFYAVERGIRLMPLISRTQWNPVGAGLPAMAI
jgi:hypothetical protein